MTVTIELKPETEASLSMQAAAHGLALPRYVEQVLEDQAQREHTAPASDIKERLAAWHRFGVLPSAPLLSDEAISRATIYEPRG